MDCDYELTDRHPELAFLDRLSPTEAWRAIRTQPRTDGVRRRRYVYKFRAFSPGWSEDERSEQRRRIAQIIVDGRLWLSPPAAFNDPFEMRPSVRFLGTPQEQRRVLEQRTKARMPNANFKARRKIIDHVMANKDDALRNIQGVFDRIGICSLADNPLDIVMWAHYANGHQGICIQLDVAASPTRLLPAAWVEYSDDYPVFDWAGDTTSQLRQILLRKAKHWSYEGERRIFAKDCANKFYRFDPRAVAAVILGCASSTSVHEFIKTCNDGRIAQRLPPFRIYKAHRLQERYKLAVHPLK